MHADIRTGVSNGLFPTRKPRFSFSTGAWVLALFAGVSGSVVTGCGSPPVAGERAEGHGTLQLALAAERDGVRYFLEAAFLVNGPESVYLNSQADDTSLVHELRVG